MKQITIFLLAFVVLAVVSCGARPGSDPYIPDRNLTRQDVVLYVVSDLYGYDIWNEDPCSSPFPDVENDTALCKAVDVLRESIDLMGFPDGKFKPHQEINWAETYKVIVQSLGFAPYNDTCLEDLTDFEPEHWYSPYAGSLCSKVIIPVHEIEPVLPGNSIPMDHWELFTGQLEQFLDEDTNRVFVLEIISMTLLSEQVDVPHDITCVSEYEDIPDDSLACVLTNELILLELIDPGPTNFRPDDIMNTAEISKLMVMAADLPLADPGCFSEPEPSWYEEYVNTLCADGYLNSGTPVFDPVGTMPNLELVRLATDIYIENPRYLE